MPTTRSLADLSIPSTFSVHTLEYAASSINDMYQLSAILSTK